MKRFLLTAGLWALVSMLAHAGVMESIFDKANQAFTEGQYDTAIEQYRSLPGVSEQVLFNLGNAYFLNQQPGQAILHYEHALWLNPRNPNVLANLKIARDRRGIPAPEQTWMQRAGGLLSWNGWSWLGCLALVGLCATAACRFWQKEFPGMTLAESVLILTLFVSIFGVMSWWLRQDEAILVGQQPRVRISPFEKADPGFPVEAGEKVRAKQTHGAFVYIQNQRGEKGWVAQANISKILP